MDTVVGSVFLGLAALFVVGAIGGDDPTSRKTSAQAIPGSLLFSAPFAASAVYGYYKADECKRAQSEWEIARQERAKAEQVRIAEFNRMEAERRAAEAAAEAERRAAAEQAEAERRAAEAAAEAERRAAAEQAEAERQARIAALKQTPQRTANIRITNAYTESLFRVDIILPESEEDFGVSEALRVGGMETRTLPGALVWRPGQRVLLRVGAKSLGEWRQFDGVELDVQTGKTLNVVYDWDPADATFRVRTSWGR